MRSVEIQEFTFQVETEPGDYWGWIENGHYHADFETIERFASPEVTCIDAGAWIGAYTLYASKKFKHVHAIEPDPVAFEILLRNVQTNNPDNVTLYQGALMGHKGEATIGSTILGCSCTRESCKLNPVTVPCITLREFCKDIPGPLFVKMDVEGSEAHILKDWEFFAERKPDLMLSTHLEWWKESGSDGRAELETIRKVGRLYKSRNVDLARDFGDVVFTDKEFPCLT